MKVLILAGGFAKRLQPLTADKAKTLLPLAGKAVISHIVENVPAHFPIIVSTNTAFENDFHEWRKLHADRDITVLVEPSTSEATKKGSLGAVGLAIDQFKIDEDLLIIGGDNFFSFKIEDFMAFTQNQPALAAYDIQNVEDAKKYGVVIAEGSVVKSFQEKPEHPLSTLVGACFYYVPQRYLPMISELAVRLPDRIGAVFENFLEQGVESHVYTFTGYWNDIGSFRAYVDAHIHAGASIAVPPRFLDPALGNTFAGVNHVDETCEIKNSTIKDSIILAGARIENSKIDTCIVDHDSKIENVQLAEQIVKL
ncbi:MAG: sugar phosphate nucleotidyltransferase [Patescibacteria group bacterium]|jgi:glucose-1-phosphate thymidylyltransferase